MFKTLALCASLLVPAFALADEAAPQAAPGASASAPVKSSRSSKVKAVKTAKSKVVKQGRTPSGTSTVKRSHGSRRGKASGSQTKASN